MNEETALITDLQKDVAAVAHISIVPTILEVICRATGVGFAAVARVTPERWVACGVRDEINFGLRAGGELKVDTTICHEIRQSETAVIIDDVANDVMYCSHHTPAMYGLQSYISVPLMRSSGNFFGTLCGIDPRPTLLNTPEIVGMFKTFAQLVSLHLDALELLSEETAERLQQEADNDLKEHLVAITAYSAKTAGTDNPGHRMTYSREPEFIALVNDCTARAKELIRYISELKEGNNKRY